MSDKRSKQAIEVSEMFADRPSVLKSLQKAHNRAGAAETTLHRHKVSNAHRLTARAATDAAVVALQYSSASSVSRTAAEARGQIGLWEEELVAPANLLRDKTGQSQKHASGDSQFGLVPACELAEPVPRRRQKLAGGVRITLLHRGQDARDFGHWRHGVWIGVELAGVYRLFRAAARAGGSARLMLAKRLFVPKTRKEKPAGKVQSQQTG
jgi:hypothetical protein